jgi:hypothetical protein
MNIPKECRCEMLDYSCQEELCEWMVLGGCRRGHMAWECVEGVTCSRCGERGHLQRNCRNVSCHKYGSSPFNWKC